MFLMVSNFFGHASLSQLCQHCMSASIESCKQTAVNMGTYLVQVEVGSKLPDVQLILPSAKDPIPDSFVTTQELFEGTLSAHRILV